MTRAALLTLALLALLAPTSAPAADDAEAMALAKRLLDKGAEFFRARDAMALSATYADDARVEWVDRDKATGRVASQVKQGRTEIDLLYRDLFKDPTARFDARNHVEFARLVAPDLLVIHGAFEPDASTGARYPFVQERVKQGDRWLVRSLRLYLFP